MNASQYDIEIPKFKEYVIQQINENVIEHNNIDPAIHILCDDPKEKSPLIALVPIPNEFLADDRTKDRLTEILIPQILEHIHGEGIKILCFSLITEGWSYEIKGKKPESNEEYQEAKKTAEKKEMVLISFETEKESDTRMFYKMGTKKNAEGEYIEGTWLKPFLEGNGTVEGRFSNLFRKFIKQIK